MEDNNEVLEMDAELTEEDLAAFDEDWGDDSDGDDFDLSADEESEEEPAAEEETEDAQTESPDDGSEEAEGEAEEQGEETEEGNQLFEINYLGKSEKLTLKQMTDLAQKGRDYDHVREERDKLRDIGGRHTAFLQKLADKAGVSIDEQIDLTEAMWLMDEEAEKGNTLTETEALLRVQRERGKKGETDSEAEGEELNPQVARFLSVYPEVSADDIPKEVWDMTNRMDGDLLAAYQAWEIKQLKSENARQKQEAINKKNEKRSTGPRNSAGANRQRDDFDEGWDS